MKLGELYQQAVRIGIEQDPRGKSEVKSSLKRVRDAYERKTAEERSDFDEETLRNPYADTRILYGDPEVEVRSVMVGIDIDTAELLLADTLRRNGRAVDLVISHHPAGRALANFFNVMGMQAEIHRRFGIPIHIAEDLIEERIREVEKRVLPVNHTKAVDAARLLDLPLMCVHTPSDNCVATWLQALVDQKKPDRLGDLMKLLRDIPEYRLARENNAAPKIMNGKPDRACGKVLVDMTGGTEGSTKIFKSISASGVNTLMGMHYSPEHLKAAKEEHLNVVVAGHVSSDVLGLNLLFDQVCKGRKIEIIGCSGFSRVERGEKKARKKAGR